MTAIGVSDHALVQWLRRSGALDLEPLRAQLAASLERAALAAGVMEIGRFVIIADTLVYVVEDGTVVTVIDDYGQHARRAYHPKREARRA